MRLYLQYFGGRGASGGIGTKSKGANTNGNIITFAQRQKASATSQQTSQKWDYPGEKDRVNRLIENAKSAKTINQINKAAMALKRQDEHISKLLETVNEDGGDERVLMSLRRQIRQQRMKTKL